VVGSWRAAARRVGAGMRVVFELGPEDLAEFRRALRRAHDRVRSADEYEIVEAAKHALDRLPIGGAPPFIRTRIQRVQRLIQMLEDEDWSLPGPMRKGLVEALVYFSDPDDLIPDHVGVIGLLDDAIMLELTLKAHQPTLAAYDEFCVFRTACGTPRDDAGRTKRQRLLAKRRAALVARIRKRYKRL